MRLRSLLFVPADRPERFFKAATSGADAIILDLEDSVAPVYPDFRNDAGLEAFVARARCDGFSGMFAIHPAQAPIINAAFSQSAAEIEHARTVIGAFESHQGTGVLQLNGKMIDAPHMKQAQRILAAAESGQKATASTTAEDICDG